MGHRWTPIKNHFVFHRCASVPHRWLISSSLVDTMKTTESTLPERIESVEQLEEMLSDPTPAAIDAMRMAGDLIVLGVAGKMGPTLARMAKRASDATAVKRRVIGVSRFCNAEEEARLRAHGVETIKADLLDQTSL